MIYSSVRELCHVWYNWRLSIEPNWQNSPLVKLMLVAITRINAVSSSIDLLHKSFNEIVQYLTMHHFVTEMYTRVHISVTKMCIVRYMSNALWNFSDGSIGLSYTFRKSYKNAKFPCRENTHGNDRHFAGNQSQSRALWFISYWFRCQKKYTSLIGCVFIGVPVQRFIDFLQPCISLAHRKRKSFQLFI